MLDWLHKTWLTIYGFIAQTAITTFPLLNIILIVMAGCFGSMLYGKIKSHLQDALLRGLGVLVFMMGASELWDGFFVLQTGQIETTGTFLVVVALLVGYAFGDALAFDRLLGKMGIRLYKKFIKTPEEKAAHSVQNGTKRVSEVQPMQDNTPSAEGFVLASVICAFSASTIRCTLESQMTEDAVPLLIKLGFDMVIIFVLAALYGSNVTFAAVPVVAVEGILLLAYRFVGNLLTNTLVSQLCLIGAVILIATGIGLGLRKRLRTAKFIPAYLFPIIYGLVVLLTDKLLEAL